MQLDFGMILFLVILSVGSIVMGIVLGKRFTKIVEPKQSIQEVPNDSSTLEKLLCTPMPPPPTPPPIRKIEESLADKSKRVVDNQKKQVKKILKIVFYIIFLEVITHSLASVKVLTLCQKN